MLVISVAFSFVSFRFVTPQWDLRNDFLTCLSVCAHVFTSVANILCRSVNVKR